MNKLSIKDYEQYCTGCGLCKSVKNIQFIEKDDGFEYPVLSEENISFYSEICPVSGKMPICSNSIWGEVSQVWLGWSMNDEIRKIASSGGILTSLCCYLLENNIVNGIIQTTVGDSAPYSTKTVISRNSDDVKRCMGSRYSGSSPLSNILQIVKDNERYVFVGKPCDAQALRLYLDKNKEFSNKIVLIFSFFCAGVPSVDAQKELLYYLGCNKVSDCIRLNYRGNGWPGFATAYKADGTDRKISYDESWGKILGRKIRKSCRICADGIGEYADIVCADAWYAKEDGKPDFSENVGRNIIFARNNKGADIIKSANNKGYIYIEEGEEYLKTFSNIQQHQFERRATMKSMLLAMKLLGRDVPMYDKKKLRFLSKSVPLQTRIKRFLGTSKRFIMGKM